MKFFFSLMHALIVIIVSLTVARTVSAQNGKQLDTSKLTDRLQKSFVFINSQFDGQDENWDNIFGIPGTDNVVRAIAVDGDNVYIGGDFIYAGMVIANHIVRWNRTTNT